MVSFKNNNNKKKEYNLLIGNGWIEGIIFIEYRKIALSTIKAILLCVE